MRIQKINSYSSPKFGTLIYDKKLLETRKDLAKDIKNAEKELANTKHWDLVLKMEPDLLNENEERLDCSYVYKHDPKVVYMLNFQFPTIKDNTIDCLGHCIYKVGKGEEALELVLVDPMDLVYSSKEKAKQAFDSINSYNGTLNSKVNIVKALDSAAKIISSDGSIYNKPKNRNN